MNLKGIRMITNLHCNNKCKFCYQKDKSKKILDIDALMTILGQGYASVNRYINRSRYKQYEYCTIMGGESTLLPNLEEYVKIGSLYAKQVRLTTNGKLMYRGFAKKLRDIGLTGINISIATISDRLYKEIHGTDVSIRSMLAMIDEVSEVIDTRINIPLCEENCGNDFEHLREMLDLFVIDGQLNVTMCEDIKGTYSAYDKFEKIGCTVKEVTDYGLILLDYHGKQIGYYTHRNNSYNDTDLVITPLGTFINWDGYCEAVGMNV